MSHNAREVPQRVAKRSGDAIGMKRRGVDPGERPA